VPSLRSQAETQALEQRAQHAEALFEGFDDAVFVHDLDGRILDANPASTRLLGYSREEFTRLNTRDIDDPEFAAGFGERLARQLSAGHLACEGRHRTRDGRVVPVEISTARVQLEDQPAVLAVIRDITERKALEETRREFADSQLKNAWAIEAKNRELTRSEARYRQLAEGSLDAIVVADAQARVTLFNPAAERTFGYAAADVIGRPVHLLLDHAQPGETLAHHAAGRVFPVDLSVGEMRLQEDGQHLVIYSVRDITQRKQAQAALAHQALHDSLTNLPNRVLLHDRLRLAIRAAERETASVALLIMDLDRFKEVNDTFGHHIGDLLLKELGGRLGSVLRSCDTIARLGGDEFAMLLPSATYAHAREIAERLLGLLEEPFTLGGLQLEIDASIGIAVSPEHGSDADALLRRADVAMYVAKRANSGFALYTADQDQHSPMRLALVAELRRAIDQDELSLYFQPKVAMRTGRVTCAEALVRWEHPVHGMLSPDLFVPIAEQTGLIRPLSRWVLDAALRQLNRWRQDGLDLGIAVNLSMRNLHDPEIADMIRQLLTRWGVPPQYLTIEITESSLMADAGRAMDVLGCLREMGVSVSIDDFGTGYSSLAYLKRLPVQELKIDKSFVAHMATDENDAAIVRSTVGLAHDLGLHVVAEGVEDQAAWDLLSAMGCDVAQGYFISRPLPPLVLGEWLELSDWEPRLARVA
jgi:diguanylate cyclase (GGDEF)-like protein/PAS domain S-box-containing protein